MRAVSLTRRSFLASLASTPLLAPQPRERAAVPPSIVIDALGEIHLDYEDALLEQILQSSLRGCVVTVGNPALQGASAFDDMQAELLGYDAHVAKKPALLARATKVAELDSAARDGKLALLYYTQNASPIGDDVARLLELKRLGVRIVQLTYNTRNLLGDGCLERINSGLSKFGIEVVEAMNAQALLVDVSHSGEATTQDAIAFSKKPVAITHAGCKAVFDHPRNKSDETLRKLAGKGGVIGIFQINPYLGPAERNTLETYLDHVEHALRVAGIDHVAIGSDREHRTIPDTPEEKQKLIDELSRLRPVTAASFRWPFFIAELNGPRRMEAVRRGLEKRGRPAREIDKILGGNFRRLLADTIG